MEYSEYLLITAGVVPTTHGFLGALIGGAISLVGGAAARKDAKKRDEAAAEAAKVPVETESETSHTVDLKGMNQAAIDAGWNPYTILMAGGLGAFTKSNTKSVTTGQNAMAAVPTAPSFGSVLAGASGTAFNLYREDAAAKAAAKPTLSTFPSAPPMSAAQALGLTPAGGKSARGLSFVTSNVPKASAGAPRAPEVETPKTQNPHIYGRIDPTNPGASAWTQRYGDSEVLQMIAGVSVIADDLIYNITGKTNKERRQQTTADIRTTIDAAKAGALSVHSAGTSMFDALKRNASSWWTPAEKRR